MIYTCYEMARDCRANLSEGWSHFVVNYVPVIRKLLAHYAPDDPGHLDRILLALRDPESSMFRSLEPAPERWFMAELRQKVLAELTTPPADIELDLETVASALEPLTMLEKQAAWFDTMRYPASETGAMLRVAPHTVEKIRARAAELIRGKVDAWRPNLLQENGPALGRAAAALSTKDCLSAKTFLDIIDGRMTWRNREELEHHVNACWHCIDRFCRMLEVVEVLRGVKPLTPQEADPFLKLLGVEERKKPLWKRLTGGA
ncbi:MAG TPA: hypothetical protein VGH38_17775 [Bryobacteraceae bacterium]